MLAAVLTAPGSPPIFELREVADPIAGPGDVLIRVIAAGVNPVDVKLATKARKYPQPHIMGFDAAGVVEAIGPGVTRFKPGQRVSAFGWLNRPGAFAELVSIPESTVAYLPADVPFHVAAALPIAGVTAYQALVTRAALKPGHSLLVTAGGGGVGHLALQLARYIQGSSPAILIATAHSAEAVALAEKSGATHIVDYRAGDIVERARSFTSGRGVDVALDLVGSATLTDCLAALAMGGRAVSIVETADMPVNARVLFDKAASLHFVFTGAPTVGNGDASAIGAQLEIVVALASAGHLRPQVQRVPFSDIARAFAVQASGRCIGKQVLDIQSV